MKEHFDKETIQLSSLSPARLQMKVNKSMVWGK